MHPDSDIPDAQPTASPDRMEIAHVLFMDIVGYSRQPIDEQRSMLARLQRIVRETPEFKEASSGRQLISLPTGDGMALAFFGSPEDPVQCAVEVAQRLRADTDLQLRMGVHTGAVYRVDDINANRNVAGAGINIAQRVMDCGDAGHILVSDAVASSVGQLKLWANRLHDLGAVTVKHGVQVHVFNLYDEGFGNPAPPAKVLAGSTPPRRSQTLRIAAAAALVVAIAGLAVWKWPRSRGAAVTGTAEKRVVAVLPFENIAADKSQEYFATGMTEEIQAQLAKLASLRVMSRAAVSNYQRGDQTLAQIARDLGVGSLVSGSVRLAGERIRINVELLDARNKQTMWAEQYDRKLQDVFAVQSDVAKRIAGSLQAALSPAESAGLARPPTVDVAAYDLFLRSQSLPVNDPARNREAIALLEDAVERDPAFALAHARLAVRFGFLGDFGDHAHYTRALASAQRAVALDPASGVAQHALASALGRVGRIAEAKLAYLKAVELAPNLAIALNDLSIAQMYLGEFDQALFWARRSFQLAPNVAVQYYHVAVPLSALGDDEVTERWLLEAERRFPNFQRIRLQLAGLDFLRNRAAAAVDRIRRAVARQPGNQEGQAALAEILLLTESPEAEAAIEARFREGPEARPVNLLTASFRVLQAHLLQRRGRAKDAAALLDQAMTAAQRELQAGSEFPDVRVEVAAIHALRGDRAQAVAWLEKAYQAGWRLYRETSRDPLFASLRDDPAFRDLLQRMERNVAEMRRRVDIRNNPALPPPPAAAGG